MARIANSLGATTTMGHGKKNKQSHRQAPTTKTVLSSKPQINRTIPHQNQPRIVIPRTRLDCLNVYVKGRIWVYLTEPDRQSWTIWDPRLKQLQSVEIKKKHDEIDEQDEKTLNEEDNPKSTCSAVPVVSHTTISGPSLSDAITLLARLNTRRLFKRLNYYKKSADKVVVKCYPTGKSTEEIAVLEWETLLQQARDKCNDNYIPSPYELLLFSPCPRSVTALASYPRSGNSLLRNLFERTTLRVTGSDMRGGLTKHDLVGEAAVSNNMVQFVKTHYPERRGVPFQASRVVLLVRNPYDAMESYFNLMMTGTHTNTLKEELREQYEHHWENMVQREIRVWKAFHEFWLSQKIPMLIVRYEDLIRSPDKVMSRVVQFVLEIKNMKFFENRIDRCIREEQIEKLGSYRPRSGGIGKSLQKYSPELIQKIQVGIIPTMVKLGYKEMLVPDKDAWKLEPLPNYGIELPGRGVLSVALNNGKVVRTSKLQTDWMAIKKSINPGESSNQCCCYMCSVNR